MSEVRFRSRIDPLIALLLTAPLLSVAYVLIRSRGDGVGTPLVVVGTLVLATALIGWIVLDTNYVITGTHLQIRSGPQRFRIPLASIRRVRRSHTLLAAPALSLRRLELDHGSGIGRAHV